MSVWLTLPCEMGVGHREWQQRCAQGMSVWLTLPYEMGVRHNGMGHTDVWGRMAWPWVAKVS